MTLGQLSILGNSRRSRRVGGLAAFFAVAAAVTSARADGPATSETAADALFAEAKGLMMEGEDAAACPKLAESQRLDPGTGTLLMLALCHERTGRTASAWEEYREALARAERERRADRTELARRHVASLEQRLTRVRLRVADESAQLGGFEVRRDGEPMAPATWLVPIPLDPGVHVYEAFASGERLWSTSVTVGSDSGGDQEVVIPKLRIQTAPPPPVAVAIPRREHDPPPPAPAEPSHALRVGAYGAAALAIAGLVVGSIYGVYAITDRREAERLCPAYPCAAGAADANDSAKTSAVISNIAFAAGGASAFGAVMFVLLDGHVNAGPGAPPGNGNGTGSGGAARSVAGLTLGWQGRW
jgi:hypothetical protein